MLAIIKVINNKYVLLSILRLLLTTYFIGDYKMFYESLNHLNLYYLKIYIFLQENIDSNVWLNRLTLKIRVSISIFLASHKLCKQMVFVIACWNTKLMSLIKNSRNDMQQNWAIIFVSCLFKALSLN